MSSYLSFLHLSKFVWPLEQPLAYRFSISVNNCSVSTPSLVCFVKLSSSNPNRTHQHCSSTKVTPKGLQDERLYGLIGTASTTSWLFLLKTRSILQRKTLVRYAELFVAVHLPLLPQLWTDCMQRDSYALRDLCLGLGRQGEVTCYASRRYSTWLQTLGIVAG